ncbi:MAG: response regulator [Planctomycetia bacterium]|nr:response regulator [Planctomycetia bacterium]
MASEPVEVLLVDDDPDERELSLHALRAHGVTGHIQIATDGAEALELLFGDGVRPRMILLDLNMPRVDGLEVLRQVKADARTRTIPVVLLTSSQQESDLLRGYELGVNSYLVKPVDFQEYTAVVRQAGNYWLQLNRYPRS